MKNFNELPAELQERIKNYLRAYDECPVFYENGRYDFTICIKKEYAPDHEYIGTYKAKDIFTEEERIENYINEFVCYPINYKGKRDYDLLKKMDNSRDFDEDGNFVMLQGKMVDGNFELVGLKTFYRTDGR